ncbi:hypothetical protein PVAND_017636 [Polypedilum vanderplanki]|uniref:Uncharacterized protein n=1 Tax=Polypedilum vanderplanki TaxID=319348 RepID=A0A9J6B974_POLVA|nr:hypothetical protein PVAND_017636 [Polypedilum vanderplanki]
MVLWLGMEKKIYCCDVKNLEIFKNATRIKIENAIGDHTNGKSSNKQVLGLSIWKATNMNFFPSNLEEIFPSLILINIFSSDLSQISTFDWCQFVGAEKSKSNPWIKRFMKMFKSQMPSAIFKPCPHFGKIEIKNLSVKTDLLMFAPTGFIRFTDQWFNEKNLTILYISILLKVENL